MFICVHQSPLSNDYNVEQDYYVTFVCNSLILCSHLRLTSCCNVEIKLQKRNHFLCTVGSQEPWCGDAWCQQREHTEPACGCSVRGSRTALHGSVHSHSGGRGAELAAGAGGAFQSSARERRYRAPSPRPSPRPSPLDSPEPLFPEGLCFSHLRGHPRRPNHTSRLLPCCNFTFESAGRKGLLSQPCCKFVARSAAQT